MDTLTDLSAETFESFAIEDRFYGYTHSGNKLEIKEIRRNGDGSVIVTAREKGGEYQEIVRSEGRVDIDNISRWGD